MTPTLLLSLSLLLTPQPEPHDPARGNLMGAPLSYFVDAPTAELNNLNTYELFLKEAGDQQTPPKRHPNLPDRPEFRLGPWARSGLKINAFSTDLNWLAITPTGIARAQLQGPAWAGIAFSVTRNTIGEEGKTIANEAFNGTAAGDLFQYLWPDSVGVAPSLVDEVVRAIDSTQFRLLGGATTATQANLEAFDLFPPMLAGEPNTFGQPLGQFGMVVFSVDQSSIPNVPNNWWNGRPESAATLFATSWNGTTWTTPQALLGQNEFGLSTPPTDIVAVALDGQQQTLAFVPKGVPTAKLFMFVDLKIAAPLRTAVPIKLPDDTLLETAIGLLPGAQPDDIDALCGIDPRIPGLQYFMGSPLPVPAYAEVQASLWRDYVAATPTTPASEQLVALMTGLPTTGVPIFAVLNASVNGTTMLPIASFPLNPLVPYATYEYRWTAPPVNPSIGPGGNIDIQYDILGTTTAASSPVTSIGNSHRVRILW